MPEIPKDVFEAMEEAADAECDEPGFNCGDLGNLLRAALSAAAAMGWELKRQTD